MAKSSFTAAARNFASWWDQRRQESAPQTFAVLCDCGHVIRGERRERFQSLECPSCSQQVFAIARNPRPEPVGLKRRSVDGHEETSPEEPQLAATVKEPAKPAAVPKKLAAVKPTPA